MEERGRKVRDDERVSANWRIVGRGQRWCRRNLNRELCRRHRVLKSDRWWWVVDEDVVVVESKLGTRRRT